VKILRIVATRKFDEFIKRTPPFHRFTCLAIDDVLVEATLVCDALVAPTVKNTTIAAPFDRLSYRCRVPCCTMQAPE
jgi:hypothetical protein